MDAERRQELYEKQVDEDAAERRGPRCEANVAPVDEDLSAPFHITYRPCGKRAEWEAEDGTALCGEHTS